MVRWFIELGSCLRHSDSNLLIYDRTVDKLINDVISIFQYIVRPLINRFESPWLKVRCMHDHLYSSFLSHLKKTKAMKHSVKHCLKRGDTFLRHYLIDRSAHFDLCLAGVLTGAHFVTLCDPAQQTVSS